MGLFVNACCLAAGEKIPPGATLVFEVELLAIEDGEPPKNIFKEIDVDGDNRLSKDEVSSTPAPDWGGGGNEEGEVDMLLVTQIGRCTDFL